MKIFQKKKVSLTGFTLIELLIVIAIIAVLFSAIFVVLDPLTRFRDSRDSVRWQDVDAIAGAIKLYQVDHNGQYIPAINGMATGSVYMIVNGNMSIGCDDNNSYCDTDVTDDISCVDLTELALTGYIGKVPVSKPGSVEWDNGAVNGLEGTGYILERNSSGSMTVRACESENSPEIYIIR